MFGFLKLQSTVDDDPLQSPETARAWLRCLPPQDVAGRQRQVLTALCDVRRMGSNVDRDRIKAIAFVDAAIDADRRRLIAHYVASVDRSTALAEGIWESMDQMNQAFTVAYRIALDAAFTRPRNTSYQSLIPLLLARLIRCFGTDGTLRTFRYQRWIPAKWRELHQLYRLAQERGIDRLPLTQNGPQPEARYQVIEQEYLCVLLDHRIDTGNLSPAEFDTVSERLRDWSGDLALDTAPRVAGGFVVDIEGKTGLVRRTGGERGATLRFVDTTPLVARFRHEIAALKWPRLASREAEERERQCPIAILDKTWPSIATTVDSEVRRHRREPAAAQATVCVGIAHVYDGLAVSAPPNWMVVDRSATGLRLRAPAGAGERLAVGALVAVRTLPTSAWILGAVRRVCRMSSDIVEVGVSIFADRVVAATLHSQCAARDDMHFVVDGIDVSAMGATFRGLYIPPKTQSAASPQPGTLIIATSNYDIGRRALLCAGDDVHTLVLREPIEQHADWTWTTIEAAPRSPHETM